MGNLTETEVYTTGVYQIEDGDAGTGGPDGIANAAAKALANRTKYLKAQVDALTAALALAALQGPEVPVSACPLPTIASTDHRLVITPEGGTNGGRILVPAGQRLTLAVPVVPAVTARPASWITDAWESPDLLVSSTYYLRGQIVAGALVLYLARGSDTDSIPAGRRGTDGASAGGGFPSTEQDVLFARVVTGIAGSVPTVTALANAAVLELIVRGDADIAAPRVAWNDASPLADSAATLNWARAPSVVSLSLVGGSGMAEAMYHDLTEGVALLAIRPAGGGSRYSTPAVSFLFDDDSTHTLGHVYWQWHIKA